MYNSENGFTLIEFLVSIVILMIGMLGLLQAVNLAYSHNLQNQLRNEAVMVGDARMAAEIARGYNNLSTSTSTASVTRSINNGSKTFTVTRTGSSFANSKQLNIEVHWNYKGTDYSHATSGVVSKANQ